MLNYPLYDVRSGRRLSIGPTTGAYGDTYGYPIWTPDEFHFILNYIKNKMGFHVYANTHHGGVNRTAHSPKSWHYVKDAKGRSLAADIGTYGDVNERNRITRELIPLLDRLGVAWHYARDGAVPGHYDHIHIDVSHWGRKGGSAASSYGFYTTRKKLNPYTALGGSAPKPSITNPPRVSTTKKRKPRTMRIKQGHRGDTVKVIQRIVNVKQDGSYGPATTAAVKRWQRANKVTADGVWGPNTVKKYLDSMGNRGPGSSGYAVRIIQYLVATKMDGQYGNATTKAVMEAQNWAGLKADGHFGPASRDKLILGRTNPKVKARQPRSVGVQQGAKGEFVGLVQQACNTRIKNKIKVDKSYGPATVAAVKEMQRIMRVTADGKWGPGTTRAYIALSTPRHRGHTGLTVKFVQWIAKVERAGVFGPQTEKAVKEMQAWAGIAQDGVFGPQSQAKLIR